MDRPTYSINRGVLLLTECHEGRLDAHTASTTRATCVKPGVSQASLPPSIIFNTRLYIYQPEVHNLKVSVVKRYLIPISQSVPNGRRGKIRYIGKTERQIIGEVTGW